MQLRFHDSCAFRTAFAIGGGLRPAREPRPAAFAAVRRAVRARAGRKNLSRRQDFRRRDREGDPGGNPAQVRGRRKHAGFLPARFRRREFRHPGCRAERLPHRTARRDSRAHRPAVGRADARAARLAGRRLAAARSRTRYVVPGGRFREMYYWDSYFTMVGLQTSGRDDLVAAMVENFAGLIDRYGHIPNGSRSYYLSRSQPPFFAAMVELQATHDGVARVDPAPAATRARIRLLDGGRQRSWRPAARTGAWCASPTAACSIATGTTCATPRDES